MPTVLILVLTATQLLTECTSVSEKETSDSDSFIVDAQYGVQTQKKSSTNYLNRGTENKEFGAKIVPSTSSYHATNNHAVPPQRQVQPTLSFQSESHDDNGPLQTSQKNLSSTLNNSHSKDYRIISKEYSKNISPSSLDHQIIDQPIESPQYSKTKGPITLGTQLRNPHIVTPQYYHQKSSSTLSHQATNHYAEDSHKETPSSTSHQATDQHTVPIQYLQNQLLSTLDYHQPIDQYNVISPQYSQGQQQVSGVENFQKKPIDLQSLMDAITKNQNSNKILQVIKVPAIYEIHLNSDATPKASYINFDHKNLIYDAFPVREETPITYSNIDSRHSESSGHAYYRQPPDHKVDSSTEDTTYVYKQTSQQAGERFTGVTKVLHAKEINNLPVIKSNDFGGLHEVEAPVFGKYPHPKPFSVNHNNRNKRKDSLNMNEVLTATSNKYHNSHTSSVNHANRDNYNRKLGPLAAADNRLLKYRINVPVVPGSTTVTFPYHEPYIMSSTLDIPPDIRMYYAKKKEIEENNQKTLGAGTTSIQSVSRSPPSYQENKISGVWGKGNSTRGFRGFHGEPKNVRRHAKRNSGDKHYVDFVVYIKERTF